MANVDRPNGFKIVKTLSGAPISSMIRSVGVTDGTDIFVGDLISLTSGLAAVAATNDTRQVRLIKVKKAPIVNLIH